MINERFKTYFEEEFFKNNPEEFSEFIISLEKPIPRTIRIKKEMREEVKTRLTNDGWILWETPIEGVFSLERKDDFNPLERRIGFSIDHLVGNFYIQELAAAHPVSILADGQEDSDKYLILDMASSPGGKTTQIAEYYPNSFIVANEPTRERIPQLLQNLERMSSPNIGITLYPWQFWKNLEETFDKVLLDAPCSGEGTLYKWTDATKHWHIKNIKNIARLQEKLLDAAVHTLKVGGEMIYSTCSLNRVENEEVVDRVLNEYSWSLEILYQKKFWPHKDKTGGFFITKIKKVKTLEKTREKSPRLFENNKKIHLFRGTLTPWKIKSDITLYEHEGKILAVKNAEIAKDLQEKVFFMKYGEFIGSIEHGTFSPHVWAYKNLELWENIKTFTIPDQVILDEYLRGYPIKIGDGYTGYILIKYEELNIALEFCEDGTIKNTFPKDWRRK